MRYLLCVVGLLAASASAAAQGHDHDHAAMNRRGDQVMGFAQDRTRHHFRLKADGGEIDVAALDPQDAASIEQIRSHLRHISMMFAAGRFDAPFLIHAQTPPGAGTMARLKDGITYTFEAYDTGGRVRIRSADRGAVKAIHAFLRFQIVEHRTGEPLEDPK